MRPRRYGGLDVECATRHERTSQRSRVTYETVDAEGSVSMSDKFVMRDQFERWQRVWHQGQYDLIHSCHPGDGHGLHVGGRPAGFTEQPLRISLQTLRGQTSDG